MLELEARAVSYYTRGRQAGAGVVDGAVLSGVFADVRFARLSDEQRRFVEGLTTSGMRIQAAVGAAGSGKTTALEAAVEAWHRAGFDVLGAAVGGTQTVVLGEEAQVESRTVASVIARYFHFDDLATITDRTVLLVDEASLVSTQDFALMAQAVTERGATMRFVGDPAQHSAVAAGGVFRHLVEQYPDEAPALTHIYRQQGPEMAEVRLANAEYREGKITEALDRLARDGRITEAESAEQALDLLTCAWYVERQRRLDEPGRRASSMTAEHHFERVALNARARSLLQADGTLAGRTFSVGRLEFQRGDEVIARVGDRSLRAAGATRREWVRNGSLGIVREVHDAHLVVDFDRWGRVVVPANYIDQDVAPGIRGGLQHAYALTTHAAEGSTYAVAVPLLTDASSRAGTYVAVTRGQFDLHAVLVRRRALVPPPTDDQLPVLTEETDALRTTARRLEADLPEQLASEVDPLAARVHELAQHRTLPELAEHA
jgi:ATP-dependent exoDNAse (exonuclease V) alpha subunit